MNPILRQVIASKQFKIPRTVRPHVISCNDARDRADVYYGLNQLRSNGNFVNTTGWAPSNVSCTIAAVNNVLQITGNGTTANVSMANSETGYNCGYNPAGRKFGVIAFMKVINAGPTYLSVAFRSTQAGSKLVGWQVGTLNPVVETVYPIKQVITIPSDWNTNDLIINFSITYPDAATANGKIVEISNIMFYDLTADIGAGNELLAAEFADVLNNHGSRYWEGVQQVCCNPSFKYGTIVQSLINGNFHNGITGWVLYNSAINVVNEELVAVGNGVANHIGAVVNTGVNAIQGHKYYTVACIKALEAPSALVMFFQSGASLYNNYASSAAITNQFVIVSGITAAAVNSSIISLYTAARFTDAATANGKTIKIDNVMFFDLTAAFGSGNEPTKAEMDAAITAYFEGSKQIAIPLAVPKKYYWADTIGKIQAKYKSMNQKCVNGSFENTTVPLSSWTENSAGSVMSNDYAKVGIYSLKMACSGVNQSRYQDIVFPNGHIIYFGGWAKCTAYTNGGYQVYSYDYGGYNNQVTPLAFPVSITDWVYRSATRVAGNGGVRLYPLASGSPNLTAYFDAITCFDLTDIFGAGNEPTAVQMDAIIAYTSDLYWYGVRDNVLVNPWDVPRFGNGRHLKLNNFAYNGSTSDWLSNPPRLFADATDDYASRSEPGIIPANSSFSIIFITSPVNNLRLFSPYNAVEGTIVGQLQFTDLINCYCSWNDVVTEGARYVSGGDDYQLVADKFYLLCLAYNHENKTMRLFINGTVFRYTTLPNGNIAANYFTILKTTSVTNGSLSLFAIINKAISDKEVKQLFDGNRKDFGI